MNTARSPVSPDSARPAFTLVEILIVVVILGILAAIVIPQFTDASMAAKSSSVRSQLQSLRSQLQVYQVQHVGNYPTFAQMWVNMTSASNISGTTGTAGTSFPYGPYFQQAPTNPFTSVSTVVDGTTTTAGSATTGWLYNSTTGAVYASVPSAQASTLGLTTNDVATY